MEKDKAVRSAASSGSQCVGQSGAGHLAQLSVNVLCLHKAAQACGGSISLSQNNFAKFLATALTRMILRSLRSSLLWMSLFIFGRATRDIFIEIRGVLVFVCHVIRSNIAFRSRCLFPIRVDRLYLPCPNCTARLVKVTLFIKIYHLIFDNISQSFR